MEVKLLCALERLRQDDFGLDLSCDSVLFCKFVFADGGGVATSRFLGAVVCCVILYIVC